jgi:phosphate transport system substrate-binding protein
MLSGKMMVCGAAALWMLLWSELSACAGELTVAGSGSCLAIAQVLAREFTRHNPDITVSVPHSMGTAGGIKAAAEGAIDIGLVARLLKPEEELLNLTYRRFARAVVVLAANPSVAEDNIRGTDLVDIYAGTRSRWKNGRPIVVLTREPQDSSILALRSSIKGFGKAYDESWRNKTWTTLFTYQSMNHYLEKTPDALGISDLGSIAIEKLKVKPLAFDGVSPSPANVRNGRYPLALPYGFVYRARNLKAEAKEFLDFVQSAHGRKILEKYRYIPE